MKWFERSQLRFKILLKPTSKHFMGLQTNFEHILLVYIMFSGMGLDFGIEFGLQAYCISLLWNKANLYVAKKKKKKK